MELSTFIGSVGVLMLLLAFVLLQYKVLSQHSQIYIVLNFLGAALAMYSSYLINFMPFVVLEGTWALVSLKILISSQLKNKSNEC